MPDLGPATDAALARLRRFLEWLVRLRGSPEAIASGIAIGTVVAFTPTIGFQMVIALGIATLLGANRPAAVVPTWLTNPITIPPAYAFTYYVGSFFWSAPGAAGVDRAALHASREIDSFAPTDMWSRVEVFLDLGADVFVALWIGGLLVGGVAAAILYPVTVRTVTRLRARRARRRDRRRAKLPAGERPAEGP